MHFSKAYSIRPILPGAHYRQCARNPYPLPKDVELQPRHRILPRNGLSAKLLCHELIAHFPNVQVVQVHGSSAVKSSTVEDQAYYFVW